MLPRVTLASVLSPSTAPRRTPDTAKSAASTSGSKTSYRGAGGSSSGSSTTGSSTSKIRNKSILKRLLSKCTVKEPTYDEVRVLVLLPFLAAEREAGGGRGSGGMYRKAACGMLGTLTVSAAQRPTVVPLRPSSNSAECSRSLVL